MTYPCHYHGKKERCLVKGGKYPITKSGKISRERIYGALRYAPRYGELSDIKKAGICKLAKKEKIKSKHCKG